MPQYLLKDGRTVNDSTTVDFDATHTNCVNALTQEDYLLFVESVIPDPPPSPPPPEPTPAQKLEYIGLTVSDLKSLLGIT